MNYEQITGDEAREIMERETGLVILDCREQHEYIAKHIPGSIVIPYHEVTEKVPELIPDKSQKIMIYCRSGRRSKIASLALADIGYTNIIEFGGIIDWKYEIVEGE